MGLQWSPLIMIPGLLALSWTLRQVPEMSRPHAHERSTWRTLRPAAVPLTLLYFTIVLRTATTYGFMTFTPTLLTQQGFSIGAGEHGRVAVSVLQRHRRIPRRAARRSHRRAAA